MAFINLEMKRKLRLKRSKVIELCDGDVKVRIAPMAANSAFEMSSKGGAVLDSRAELFMGSCLDENGDELFKNAEEVKDFLKVIDIDDATKLVTEVTAMSKTLEKKAAEGNSDGTPSVT